MPAGIFEIEHYPLTNLYYPKYKGQFLKGDSHTGIIRVINTNYTISSKLTLATSYTTEKQAQEFIELFKEQHLKVNVISIPID